MSDSNYERLESDDRRVLGKYETTDTNLYGFVGTAETESLLTDRQRQLLDAAVRMGYFEVPRRCTLAELATGVGVDKSTASTVVRRGEGRIVKWFLSGPGSGR